MELFEEKEFSDAASSFSELLQQRSEELGERAYDCADVAYYYGLSLFEHGKNVSQAQLLGEAAMRAVRRKAESQAAATEEAEGEGSTMEQQRRAMGSSSDNGDSAKSEKDEEGDEEEEEEESPEECFETAYSVLELARQIYTEKLKQCSSLAEYRHVQRKLIDVYVTLAEMASENEEFAEAVTEYERALGMLQERGDEPRRIADIHMQIALSLMMDDKAHRAKFHFERAAERLKEMEKKLSEEREDVAGIVKDLEERILELKQEQSNDSNVAQTESLATVGQEPAAAAADEQKGKGVVHVLNVRRKRTHGETSQEESQGSDENNKRAKTE